MTAHNALMNLAGRGLIGAIFVLAGISKIASYSGTQAYMASHGLPGELLAAAIALEIGAGAALISGWHTRRAAMALALFSMATAAIFHGELGDPAQLLMLMKNLAMAGGLLVLAASGASALSLDARRHASSDGGQPNAGAAGSVYL